jgi:PAS domain-containing protein
MTLEEIFNAQVDLESIIAMARQGLAWWVDEIAAMAPVAWRERLSSRPQLWMEPRAEGGWRFWKGARLVAIDSPGPGAGTRIGLLAPPDAILVREITTARMSAADVRRMLSLDLDRESPLAPELVHFDVEIIDHGDGDGKQRVRLGILQRDEAARLLAAAREAGCEPAALAARAESGGEAPRFDFLPQAREAAGEKPASRAKLYWWSAVAALVVLNIAILVGRDMLDLYRLRASVDAQRPMVNLVLRLRQHIEAEDARRRELLARGQHNEPLKMLGKLTQAMPVGAWTQHLEWNGQALRIVGFKHPDVDLLAAIRGSGAFVNPRAAAAEPPPGVSPFKPYDITADARQAPRP